VPLYERRQRAGAVVANRTLLYYNGIVLDLPAKKFHSDQAAQMQSVLAALERTLADAGYAHVTLHNHASLTDLRSFLANGWEASLAYTYVVPLTDMTTQWERVDQNLKRLIRRCEREGVTYREDADFDALFRLHWQTHKRKGAPLYLSEAAFRRFFERVHGCGFARLGHAVYQDKVVASQLMLAGPHPVSHTICAGADEDYLRLGASAFLRWHAFQSLHRDGFVANDLTDASLNPVTRFKSQLGGDLTPTLSISRTDSWLFRVMGTAREIRTGLQQRLRRSQEQEAA
jgi:lipid II:glycine glycyltransferase (peptidoglycan interpeptide bridge formation enzyme)